MAGQRASIRAATPVHRASKSRINVLQVGLDRDEMRLNCPQFRSSPQKQEPALWPSSRPWVPACAGTNGDWLNADANLDSRVAHWRRSSFANDKSFRN